MTQTEFANELGMKQTSVSSFEQVGATVTDQTLKIICTVYNLNKDYLRYGDEPMYNKTAHDIANLYNLVKIHGASKLELEIIKSYFELDKDVRHAVVEQFKKCFMENSDKGDIFDDIPATPEELEKEYPLIGESEKSDTEKNEDVG